ACSSRVATVFGRGVQLPPPPPNAQLYLCIRVVGSIVWTVGGRPMRRVKQLPLVIGLLVLAPLAEGADRTRAVRLPSPHKSLVVEQEYRIPATPDSPWLESIAVAMG